jgi:hypothetical protein
MKLNIYCILFAFLFFSLASCSYSKKFTNEYYQENRELLQSIQQRYKSQYDEHPFSIEIKDKTFKTVGLEIITDTIRYIYSFDIADQSMQDTLTKYRFNASIVNSIIEDMQKIHCTWLTNLDYYESLQKKYLVFLSIRHKKLESIFRKDKYFTLAFFNTPQPFDNKGRMLDRKDRKQLRKINGAVLFRLDNKTGYALTATFR